MDDRMLSQKGKEAEEKRGVCAGGPLFFYKLMELNLKNFLKYQKQFSLGNLTTESFHPKSKNLSSVLKSNLKSAIKILQDIDQDALDILRIKARDVYALQV